MKLRLQRVLVMLEDGGYLTNSLLVDGELWLVPEWRSEPTRPGFSTPARAIRATELAQSVGPDGVVALRDPVPISVFDGLTRGPYEVVDGPPWCVEDDRLT